MTEFILDGRWTSRSALSDEAAVMTVAADGTRGGVSLLERTAGSVLHVMARRGRSANVRSAICAAIRSEVPSESRYTSGAAGSVVWSGPGQWLILSDAHSGLRDTLASSLTGFAAVIDQTAARVVIEASGPDVRRALAKGIGLDLHPAVFDIGHAAMTDVAHVSVHLWRTADANGHAVFQLALPRSTAGTVWHTLVASAAEYGLEAHTLASSR